jgi:shikimate kinase
MGSGKTTLGKKAASLLELNFIDLDDYIQTKEQKSVNAIFDEQGETSFRKIEAKCLEEVLKTTETTLISLGGGTICFENNLTLIKKSGLLIYLELSPQDLATRLIEEKHQRPLLKNVSESDLKKIIEYKLEQRKKFYHQAHITVNAVNLTPLHLYKSIIEFNKKNISSY